jgi:hypothetical protein
MFSFCSYFDSMDRQALATFPYVVVRIACRNCKRRGSYRLARLAERYGADTTLDELLIKVTADCNLASNRTGPPTSLISTGRSPISHLTPLRVIAGNRRASMEA